jgi:acetolactate decarboxylase
MKRLVAFGYVLSFLVAGCAAPREGVVFQTSTIDALLAGVYDGDMDCRHLLKQGDFGIGTFDGLDGEMVLLGGVIYQVKADGKVYKPHPSTATPFATVCQFRPEISFTIDTESDYPAIQKLIDERAPNRNVFAAIRITGHFKSMHTRSVPRQAKPYPPLQEVTRNQPEFNMQDLDGTIVGFRSPVYVTGINVPGYHLHFISRDRTRGGHVLAFELAGGECQIDILNQFFLRLPESAPGFAETDLSKDRSQELKEVETRRGR